MKLVFFGTPQFAVPSLRHLLGHPDFEVVSVVTQPDKRRGRGSQASPSPVKVVALEAQCPVWQPARIKRDQDILQRLKAATADVFVVVAYGQILPQEVLDIPRLGCVNAHGSLLPAYRGAAPIQWSIYHGETETGITTMLMDASMDTGPMLLKATVPIHLMDNAQTLAERLAELSADLLITTLQQLEQDTITPEPQADTQATYAPLIQKSDYSLDWRRSAHALHNQIRGFYPNCLTTFRDSGVKVLTSVPLGNAYWPQLPDTLKPLQTFWTNLERFQPDQAQPGKIIALAKGYGPIVQTGEGHLLLQQIQPAGKRPQSGWDFANGNHLQLGEYFS